MKTGTVLPPIEILHWVTDTRWFRDRTVKVSGEELTKNINWERDRRSSSS